MGVQEISCGCCFTLYSGGGGLAVLGTGTLHTWADSLRNLVPHFADHTRIDEKQLMDDSAYRFVLCSAKLYLNVDQ